MFRLLLPILDLTRVVRKVALVVVRFTHFDTVR